MIGKFSKKHISQRGAVSLFIVIFTTLLMTIVTISFVQLMTHDQQQATYSDLSQSAYDSAQAGVEDAKRALLLEQDCQSKDTKQCKDVRTAIDAQQCNTLGVIFGSPNDSEVDIQQTVGDKKLDQAYTCVKILSDTPDFLGSIDPGASPVLIPLRGVDSFSKIIVSWGLSKSGGLVDLPQAGGTSLPAVGDWPESRPSLLRAQLINGKDKFWLSNFDDQGYSDTLFLYPSRPSGSSSTSFSFAQDGRRSGSSANTPQQVQCASSVNSGAYSCQVTLDVGPAIKAGSQTAFLSLGAFYNATDFKVELRHGNEGSPVLFDGVQPEIDSTGRANDLFRRVVSRVEMKGSFNYPQAALETAGKLCKNFSVTTDPKDYSTHCTP